MTKEWGQGNELGRGMGEITIMSKGRRPMIGAHGMRHFCVFQHWSTKLAGIGQKNLGISSKEGGVVTTLNNSWEQQQANRSGDHWSPSIGWQKGLGHYPNAIEKEEARIISSIQSNFQLEDANCNAVRQQSLVLQSARWVREVARFVHQRCSTQTI